MNRPEQKIQMDVVKWCYANIHPSVDWWGNNSNAHSAAAGYRNKRMGVKRGIPDMIFCWGKEWLFVEIKADTGLSPEQKCFFKRMQERGYYGAVVNSVEDMAALVMQYKIPKVTKREKPELPF